VAGHLGYCGLDRRRTPLVGDEIRACWEASPAPRADAQPVPSPGDASRPAAAVAMNGGRDFVEVVAGQQLPVDRPEGDAEPTLQPPRPVSSVPAVPTSESRWTFWGELER
jgi:hypothetical protein